MLHPSTQRLILRLSEMTEAGGIPWRHSEADGEAASFETEGYTVEISPAPLRLRILARGGREVETANAADLGATPAPDGASFAARVAAMAAAAGRLAGSGPRPPSARLDAVSAEPSSVPPAALSRPPAPGVSSKRPMFGAIETFARSSFLPADQGAGKPGEPAANEPGRIIMAGIHAVSLQHGASSQDPGSRQPMLATPVGDALPGPAPEVAPADNPAANPFAPWR